VSDEANKIEGSVPVPTTIDLMSLDTVASSEEGAVMEVRHPKTGDVLRHDDGRPYTITYRGKDSEAFRDLARKQQDRRVQANMRTRTPVLSSVIERDDIELIVAATMSWDIVYDGGVPKSDPKLYRQAYTKLPWLKEQGDEFVGVRANFIKS
jgi:hypothetical protein